MKRSTQRILTTHTGSLPRPTDLAEMLEAQDHGTLEDAAALAARVRESVAEVVQKQLDVGLDIINDGEQGKVGFSTYVRYRLTGFEGTSSQAVRHDWADYPETLGRRSPTSPGLRLACNGPINWKDREATQGDLDALLSAVAGSNPQEVFMTAASPGVISHTLPNEYYPSRSAYLERLAEVMKEEYDAIHLAGFLLQLDCPDLAMGRHMWFPDLTTQEFLKVAQENLDALDHAVRDIPPDRLRLHLCWGNY